MTSRPWWATRPVAEPAQDGTAWPVPDRRSGTRTRRFAARITKLAGAGAVLTLITGANFGFAHRISDVGVAQSGAGCLATLAYTPDVMGPDTRLDSPRTPDGRVLPNVPRHKYPISPPPGGAYSSDFFPDQTRPFRGEGKPLPVEVAVRGERAGATIVWYRPSKVSATDLADLKTIAARAGGRSLIVMPWEESRGPWTTPPNQTSHQLDPIAISTWRHVTLCQKVSGVVVQTFMDRFPESTGPDAIKPK